MRRALLRELAEMTFLTQAEQKAVFESDLPSELPYRIQGVNHGMFCVARHYGGCTFQGRFYVYIEATDELIRDDVLKFITKARRQARRDELAAEQAREGELNL